MEDKIKGKEDLFKLKDIKKTLFLVVIFVDRFCDCQGLASVEACGANTIQ